LFKKKKKKKKRNIKSRKKKIKMFKSKYTTIQKNLYNILFIQENPWRFICFVLFTITPGEYEVIGASIYPY